MHLFDKDILTISNAYQEYRSPCLKSMDPIASTTSSLSNGPSPLKLELCSPEPSKRPNRQSPGRWQRVKSTPLSNDTMKMKIGIVNSTTTNSTTPHNTNTRKPKRKLLKTCLLTTPPPSQNNKIRRCLRNPCEMKKNIDQLLQVSENQQLEQQETLGNNSKKNSNSDSPSSSTNITTTFNSSSLAEVDADVHVEADVHVHVHVDADVNATTTPTTTATTATTTVTFSTCDIFTIEEENEEEKTHLLQSLEGDNSSTIDLVKENSISSSTSDSSKDKKCDRCGVDEFQPSFSLLKTPESSIKNNRYSHRENNSIKYTDDVGLFNCENDALLDGKVLGEGTDGTVEKATINGRRVALKRCKPPPHATSSTIESMKKQNSIELHYLRRVKNHPGFIKCLGGCDGIDHTCIAFEIMPGKLSQYQRKVYGTKTPLSYQDSIHIMKQVCVAMNYLHIEMDIAHGDLAFRNILVDRLFKSNDSMVTIKISDFGRIKFPKHEGALFKKPFSFYKNYDVGNFGRDIMYRLFTGETLPESCVQEFTIDRKLKDVAILSQNLPANAKELLGDYYNMFIQCCSKGIRPTFQEILDHIDNPLYFKGDIPLLPLIREISTDSVFTITSPPPVKRSSLGGRRPLQFSTPTQGTPLKSGIASGRVVRRKPCSLTASSPATDGKIFKTSKRSQAICELILMKKKDKE